MTSAEGSTNSPQPDALDAGPTASAMVSPESTVSPELPLRTISPGLRLRMMLKDIAPVACLLATFGAAALVYYDGGDSGGQVMGFARTTLQAVTPLETGRVSTILVAVGERVSPGQIVATLDTSTIDAEIAVAEAQRAQFETGVLAEQTLLAQRLDQDVEGLERERALQREEQARVRAEADVLAAEVSRVKGLVANKQAVLGDLTLLGLRQATADALVATKPQTLGLLGKQLAVAQQRRQKVNEQTSALSAKLSAGLVVAERNIELLHQRREGYALRAGRAGRVSVIERWAGEVVEAGKPVMQIVSADDRVIGCVPEQHALGLREGDTAKLRVRGQRGTALRGKAIALGPLVTQLPARCWVSPRIPMWGREVVVAIDEPVELVPGEAFDIRFEHTRSTPAPQPPLPAVEAKGPLPMTVPPALVLRSRFEPSGVIIQPAESRYLVVSDDTGRNEDEGAPWIFAMSADGGIEPDPVIVSGVRELDDVEAIAAPSAQELYLLSSQSYSKKGRRKPARTALLHLQAEGRGFRVDGQAHLAQELDRDPERARALGLTNGTSDLDIEGLVFQDGALYLGLKAPLDARGNAMIWRMASPGALFDTAEAAPVQDKRDDVKAKRLERAGLSLWATVHLDIELGGQIVPGGISDLSFLPGGALAIASTPSTAEAEAGAVWRVDTPQAGTLTPRLIQRFASLKPEGLSPSFTPGMLMVVFDTGAGTPAFQEIAWGP